MTSDGVIGASTEHICPLQKKITETSVEAKGLKGNKDVAVIVGDLAVCFTPLMTPPPFNRTKQYIVQIRQSAHVHVPQCNSPVL